MSTINNRPTSFKIKCGKYEHKNSFSVFFMAPEYRREIMQE